MLFSNKKKLRGLSTGVSKISIKTCSKHLINLIKYSSGLSLISFEYVLGLNLKSVLNVFSEALVCLRSPEMWTVRGITSCCWTNTWLRFTVCLVTEQKLINWVCRSGLCSTSTTRPKTTASAPSPRSQRRRKCVCSCCKHGHASSGVMFSDVSSVTWSHNRERFRSTGLKQIRCCSPLLFLHSFI